MDTFKITGPKLKSHLAACVANCLVPWNLQGIYAIYMPEEQSTKDLCGCWTKAHWNGIQEERNPDYIYTPSWLLTGIGCRTKTTVCRTAGYPMGSTTGTTRTDFWANHSDRLTVSLCNIPQRLNPAQSSESQDLAEDIQVDLQSTDDCFSSTHQHKISSSRCSKQTWQLHPVILDSLGMSKSRGKRWIFTRLSCGTDLLSSRLLGLSCS